MKPATKNHPETRALLQLGRQRAAKSKDGVFMAQDSLDELAGKLYSDRPASYSDSDVERARGYLRAARTALEQFDNTVGGMLDRLPPTGGKLEGQ